MNKDEFKEALKCCETGYCRMCPYYEYYGCETILKKNALNLITEQEKEIERLKDDYAKLQEQFTQYQKASDKEILAQVKQAKIDVLNELKEKAISLPAIETYHVCNLVDEVIKEQLKK